ncbi:hypothetical protein IEO21_06434 [Rhodonia placenta]|uniref:U4/U6 snRNA-associated-splicing factor PRP24 n=1 Tax=Rhodonia placenta TaxID=104341 RepID=A0A8H7P0C0_9APHY|nr:hypothetical protein IEO21_06434 [Postia placenta]
MEEADALEALSTILTRLTENPYDLSLHAEHVRLARETGMQDQVESALEMVTAFWAAGDHIWQPLLEHKVKSGSLESAEHLQEIMGMYERAEADYLSIPLLKQHIELLIDRYEHFSTSETKPDDLGELFTPEWTSAAIASVVTKGVGHLTQSQQLWNTWYDWELERLQATQGLEREALVAQVEAMLLERIQQPHFNHEETFQAYSSFTTNYRPPGQYEELLVNASKLRSQAKKATEKREQFETYLANSGFSLEGYAYYIAAERRRGKPDLFILSNVYERAIAEGNKRRWAGETNAEQALQSFWAGYADALRMQDVDADLQREMYQRALRSVPVSGGVRAQYIRFLERTSASEAGTAPAIVDVYEETKTIAPLQADVEQLVPTILARAGYGKRQVEAGQMGENGLNDLVDILMDGISRVRNASPAGDPRLRIEKYFSAVCTRLAGLSEHALILWEDATKHYKTSYLAWTSYTDILIKQGLYVDARNVFRDVCAKNLDWSEALWEAWVSFEQLHGSVEEFEDCLDRIERAQFQVAARRAKDMERAEHAAAQLIAEQQANAMSVAAVAPAGAEPIAMEVDVSQPVASGSGTKRKAEDSAEQDESKKPRIDRENCTVFVADLPSDAKEDDLASLFKDCGAVREIKLTQLPNSLVATVEFMERDSIPAALTKDKKRIHGQEVAVHLAWQSTLYVTNFPEKADDAFIRNIFTKYGTIFDVRWPSKKFKATRRFCYIQYTSPASAQAALKLHGEELEPDLSMNVYISNPERKKERTDSDANDREIYVAGLSRFATKGDLETLFKTYGVVKEVRMALDDNGRPKGFAFVEFEQEQDAVAALSANNYELKKRRIAVTLADTRNRAKNRDPSRRTDARNRSIRVRKLPPNTQEGLLQQFLEKLAPVKRVEVFADRAEAEVEFENAADVGRLLLRSEPIVFDGVTLELVAETSGGLAGPRATPSLAVTGGLFVPRTAVSRPRAGLGSKKRVSTVSATGSQSAPNAQNTQPTQSSQGKGQNDFRKMLGGGG